MYLLPSHPTKWKMSLPYFLKRQLSFRRKLSIIVKNGPCRKELECCHLQNEYRWKLWPEYEASLFQGRFSSVCFSNFLWHLVNMFLEDYIKAWAIFLEYLEDNGAFWRLLLWSSDGRRHHFLIDWVVHLTMLFLFTLVSIIQCSKRGYIPSWNITQHFPC